MNRRWVGRCTSTLTAALVVSSLLVSLAPPAGALAGFKFTRFAGANRFDTARLIAADGGASAVVVIARGDVFADAMAGTYLAGIHNAPVILTRSDGLPAESDAALRTIGATRAYIVGSTSAVSPSVEAGLRARGLVVERIGGATRYDTAAEIARHPTPSGIGTLDGLKTAILVSGLNFPDAISGGPLSFARRFPTLLTHPTTLSPQALSVLESQTIGHVLILGGTSAVTTPVETALRTRGYVVTRAAGANRSATSVEVAKLAVRRLGFSTKHVNVARGDDFADALALAPHAGRERAASAAQAGPASAPAPVLLTASPTFASEEVLTDLRTNARTLENGHIAGGPSAISEALEQQLAQAAAHGYSTVSLDFVTVAPGGTIPGNVAGDGIGNVSVSGCGFTGQSVRSGAGSFTLTFPPFQPAGECALTFTSTFTTGQATETDTLLITVRTSSSNQTYGVTGPSGTNQAVNTDRTCTVSVPANAVIDFRLFPTNQIGGTGGQVTFTDINSDNLADELGTGPDIVSVNGAPVAPADEVNDIASGTGTLTVTMRSAQAEDVTLVAWTDLAGLVTNALDLTVPATTNASPKLPREAFGIGCRTTFVPADASGGAFGPLTVASTDKGADFFISGASTFVYDTNDTFTIDGVPQASGSAGHAAFEARLSPGDSVGGSYSADRAAVSTFNLTDAAPLAPSSLTATASGSGASLAFPESTTPTTDAYNVYRVLRPSSGTCPEFNAPSGRAQYPFLASVIDPSTTSATSAQLAFSDPALNTATTYCYAVAAVDEGDESASGAQASVTTTGGAPAPPPPSNAPTITDARAQEIGGGLSGVVDAGDLLQFVFSKTMATTIADPGSVIRIQDADGTVADLTCNGNVTCTLLAAGRYEAAGGPTDLAASQVLRVSIASTPLPLEGFAGTDPGLRYPVTVTAVSTHWRDPDANQLVLTSPGTNLRLAAIGPEMISAVGSAAQDTVTVTFSAAVSCTGANAGQFTYTDSGNTAPVAATSVQCAGTTVTLTLPAPAIEPGDVGDALARIRYSQSSDPANRVRSSSTLVHAVSPESQAVTVQG